MESPMMESKPLLALHVLLAAGLLKTLITLVQRARSPVASVPGPWLTKWTSMVLSYFWIRGERAVYVDRLHQQYGPVVRLAPREVDVCSVAGAKQIHSYRKPFLKSDFYKAIGESQGTANIFSTDDLGLHTRYRRLLSGPMSKSSLKSVEPIVKSRVELAIQRMGEEMKSRGCIDVLHWWTCLTTDVIGELSFGDSFRMLEIGKKTEYVEDLGKLAALSGLRLSFPFLIHLATRLPFSIPVFRAASDATERVTLYAQQSIQRHENIVNADPENAKPTLFHKLYKAGEEGMLPGEIEANARVYIVAGSDTTAHTLTYLVWMVCKDAAIKKRLVDEVATLPEDHSDHDAEQLPYLVQVIQETLRLCAAAPGPLSRVVPDGGCLVDGYWLPGGLTVATQAWSMHRNNAIFRNPEQFDPSRWENATKEMKDSFIPFGAGSRNCLGLHLAEMELRLATARFFRTFPNAKVSTREGFNDEDMAQVVYFLMFPKGKRCLIEGS